MRRLTRKTVSNVVFGCLAAACVALWVAFALAFAGVLPIIAEPQVAERGETPPLAAPAATTVETAKPSPAAQKRTPETPPTAVVVMRAVRGDSWFSARLGSEEGRVLDERILSEGESVRLEGRRIWLSVGAAGNVELTVDGKPRPLSPGTVSVVLTGTPPAEET